MSTTRFLGGSLGLSLLVVLSTTASANIVASDGVAPRERPTASRLDSRAGMLIGGSDVGDADGFAIGLTSGLGYRMGDITVRARFDHYRVGDGTDEALARRGRGTRVGGAVRYSFANTAPDPDQEHGGAGIDLWGEVGMGIEHIAWRQGGVLDRPSGEVALGFEVGGYGRRDARLRRRHVGYFMGFRSLIARGPEMEGAAVCGGPCTQATKPSRIDVSMFFEVGLHWGR